MSLADALAGGSPINFTPPTAILEALVQSTDGFHVIVGLDPFGTFTGVRGLNAENPVFSYEELGRNGHAVQLPFNGPRKTGQVTLEWGTVLRSRFWNWFTAQTPYFIEPQPVFILHMSRRNLPIRIYLLWGCWPSQWSYSDLGNNEMAVESVTLTYDRLIMLPTALLGLAPELAATVAAAPAEAPSIWKWEPSDYFEQPDRVKWTALAEDKGGVPGQFTTEEVGDPDRVIKPKEKDPWVTQRKLQKKKADKDKWVSPWEREETTSLEAPKDAEAPWRWDALPEDHEGVAGEFFNTPLPGAYEGVAGTWGTEALPEDYVGVAGAWSGFGAGSARKGGGSGGGDGKKVEED